MNARRHPSDIQDSRVIAVLDKFVPPIIARSIVERARREAASGPDVSWTDPNGLLDRLSVGVRLFAAPEHVAAILRGITDLADDEQDGPPSSTTSPEDSGPASTLKPASVRARTEELRARHEEQPPTRRDLPPPAPLPPVSTPNAAPPPTSKRETPSAREPSARDAQNREAPSSRGSPVSRDLSITRESPSARDLGISRESPSARELGTPRESPAPAVRRDTDVPAFSTQRTPIDPGPSNRGVFPTSGHPGARPTPQPPAHRVPVPVAVRSSARGPTSEGAHAIPPPPPAANLRDPKAASPARTPPDRSSTSTTQQSLHRLAAGLEGATPRTPGIGAPAGRPNLSARGAPPPAAPAEATREITVSLETEHDIPRARQVAREICEALGTRALTQQRLVTIVSELGRNMVLYAGGGKITLRPPTGASRRVVVVAVDHGPGISNLSEIMAGRYKSRSGLGLGIVGTKRLADSFHIDTGRHGTAVSVEVIV